MRSVSTGTMEPILPNHADHACVGSAGFKVANATVSWSSDGKKNVDAITEVVQLIERR